MKSLRRIAVWSLHLLAGLVVFLVVAGFLTHQPGDPALYPPKDALNDAGVPAWPVLATAAAGLLWSVRER